MRRILLIIFLLYYSSLSAQISQETKILDSAEKFLDCIKSKNAKILKNLILSEIKITKLNDKELMDLGIKVLNEEITAGEYILKLTGNNINRFLSGENILIDYKIKEKTGIENIDNRDKVLKRYGDIFYYVKVLLKFKQGDKLFNEHECELNIIKVSENEYKIFGFIL